MVALIWGGPDEREQSFLLSLRERIALFRFVHFLIN